jgi:hypothetical protein
MRDEIMIYKTREPSILANGAVILSLKASSAHERAQYHDESRPDPDTIARSIARIEKAAGPWKDEDTDAFLDYVYERRSLPPRPAVKL